MVNKKVVFGFAVLGFFIAEDAFGLENRVVHGEVPQQETEGLPLFLIDRDFLRFSLPWEQHTSEPPKRKPLYLSLQANDETVPAMDLTRERPYSHIPPRTLGMYRGFR